MKKANKPISFARRLRFVTAAPGVEAGMVGPKQASLHPLTIKPGPKNAANEIPLMNGKIQEYFAYFLSAGIDFKTVMSPHEF